ncbi:MAG: aspartate/glutamate racemase family protein [Lautropia sp.]
MSDENTPVCSNGDGLVLGVLGGMGPEATADFLAKLVRATPVAAEQDHLRVLVDSNPKVPDRNKAIAGTGPSPNRILAEMAAGLERAGAELLVMACNTAHAFESAIRQSISIPFVSIVEEACDASVRQVPAPRRVGVLAAPGCIEAGLYQAALRCRGLEPVLLDEDDQSRFNALLYRIKRGLPAEGVHAGMKRLAERLDAQGAEVIIAACTEVPLVLSQADLDRPLIDATYNLATRCVRYALRQELLPAASMPLEKA